jgi:hypothetical protein
MTRLVARILLALLMLPIAAVFYGASMVPAFFLLGTPDNVATFLIVGAVTWAFIIIYWILLWRRSVRWTPQRIILTTAAAVAAIFPAGVIGATLARMTEDSFGVFVSTMIVILLWLTATIFIWRETRAERMERLRKRGADLVLCPNCGYNLTGLKTTQCPECGETFTLDHLLAAQQEARHETLES